jgi:hypothetical protein
MQIQVELSNRLKQITADNARCYADIIELRSDVGHGWSYGDALYRQRIRGSRPTYDWRVDDDRPTLCPELL